MLLGSSRIHDQGLTNSSWLGLSQKTSVIPIIWYTILYSGQKAKVVKPPADGASAMDTGQSPPALVSPMPLNRYQRKTPRFHRFCAAITTAILCQMLSRRNTMISFTIWWSPGMDLLVGSLLLGRSCKFVKNRIAMQYIKLIPEDFDPVKLPELHWFVFTSYHNSDITYSTLRTYLKWKI